jgi:membrane AbrB-like protein
MSNNGSKPVPDDMKPQISGKNIMMRIGLALVIGVLSGWLFTRAAMPLPWMLGPMFGNILATFAGLPVIGPKRLRPFVAVVIGVMLGSSFTPAFFGHLETWSLSLVFMGLYLFLAGAIVVPYYRYVAGFDLPTAYFSGMPGGLMEMMVVGKEMGGDERAIILAHTSRIVVVVTLVAVWFRWIQGVELSDRSQFGAPFATIPNDELVILFIVGVIGFFLGRLLRLPAAVLLGPMLVSAGVHSAGIVHYPPPQELVIVAQIFLGTIVGCRFIDTDIKVIKRAIMLGLGATAILISLTFTFATLFYDLFGQTVEQLVLAYSPGGLAEMSLVAMAMNADITYVASHHLMRIAMVMMLAPWIFKMTVLIIKKSGTPKH